MTTSSKSASSKSAPVLVALWLGVVGFGLALAALAATEPPVWDALSYVQKSFNFWLSVYRREFVDPFELPMSVRPPGTILMAYPFGWSYDYHWFYFRSLFFPVALLTAAPFIAAWAPDQPPRRNWLLAALALALAGMPILYQFQSNEELPLTANWGLVDGFIAGVAAFAAACVVRSPRNRSILFAILAAGAGAFTLWIKPAGLALMGLIGLAWLIFAFAAKPHDARFRRFAAVSVIAAAAIFALAAALAFTSAYFSAENIAFGERALGVLAAEFAGSVSLATFLAIVRASLGYVLPVLLVIGLIQAARHHRPAALAAALTLAAGSWFWLGQTDISQVRYFLPFAAMAFVFLVPGLLDWLEALTIRARQAAAVVIAAPALLTTFLLFTGAPTSVQRTLGVNLHVSDYAAENQQAQALLDALRAAQQKSARVYLAGTAAPLRNLQAVWDFTAVTRDDMPKVSALVPTDWQSLSTVRVEDLLRCDYIAILAASDAAALAARDVPDFPALIGLFNAALAQMGPDDGVTVVSETRVRLLHVTDRTRFEAAIARLERDFNLPASYRDANPPRWWSPEEAAAKDARVLDIAFHTAADPALLRTLRAAAVNTANGGVHLTAWFESAGTDSQSGPWMLFGHLVDDAGNIVGNAETAYLAGQSPTPEKPWRVYTLSYPARPPAATGIALGFFQPKAETLDFLEAESGRRDWGGKRLIIPLPSR